MTGQEKTGRPRNAEKPAAADLIDAWKEASENLRHFNHLFWQQARYFTTIIVLTVGGVGALLSLPGEAPLPWIIIPLLCLLAAFISSVAAASSRSHALHVGYRMEPQRIAELAVVQRLGLFPADEDRWTVVRDLKSPFDVEPGETSARRKVVSGFAGAVWVFLVLSAISLLVGVITWFKYLEQKGGIRIDMNTFGLALDLVGVIVLAYGQRVRSRRIAVWINSLDVTVEALLTQSEVPRFEGMDRAHERDVKRAAPIVAVGWGLLVGGLALQVIAALTS